MVRLRVRSRRVLIAATGAIVVAALVTATVRAAEAVVTFEDLSPGTTVTTQYLSRGVEFGKGPTGTAGRPPTVIEVAEGRARSGTQVARIKHGSGEFTETQVWGRFAATKRFVRVYVGMAATGGGPFVGTNVTLTAYEASGAVVGSHTQPVLAGAGYKTKLEVSLASPSIAFFRVAPPSPIGAGTPDLAIDDLTFDVLDPDEPPPPPDFGLTTDGSLLVPDIGFAMSRGATGTLPVFVNRVNGASGPLLFSVDGLPNGVTGSFTANPSTAASVALRLTAGGVKRAVTAEKITVTATPLAPAAGIAPRMLEFPLTIRQNYDLIVKGIEVTQGIQGGARAQGLHRLQPERPRPYGRVGVFGPRQAGRHRLRTRDL